MKWTLETMNWNKKSEENKMKWNNDGKLGCECAPVPQQRINWKNETSKHAWLSSLCALCVRWPIKWNWFFPCWCVALEVKFRPDYDANAVQKWIRVRGTITEHWLSPATIVFCWFKWLRLTFAGFRWIGRLWWTTEAGKRYSNLIEGGQIRSKRFESRRIQTKPVETNRIRQKVMFAQL